jgi:hypothetical protein
MRITVAHQILCKKKFQSDKNQCNKNLISPEIKAVEFPLIAVLPEVMSVCALAGVNAGIASGNAI